jgi:hypothetical protein
MLTVFIDTNIYEEENYNFDERNEVFKAFIELVHKKEIKNVIISVIDNEIKGHLKERIEENERGLKKYCKWVKNLLEEEVIKQNLNKELIDYEKFKKNSLAEIVTLENINSEIVLNKYFKNEAPFTKSKPNEFKDAFFIEGILKYVEDNNIGRFAIISKDKGIIKSFETFNKESVIVLKSIKELLDFVANYGQERKKDILEYISSYDLIPLIEEKYNVNYWDIEEENIEIKKINIMGIYGIEIIRSEDESILVACDIGIALEGKFSCLDYDNSYYSSEEGEYLYKQYINRNELMYVCDVIMKIEKDNDKFNQITIKDFPEIEIDYNTMAGIEDIY